jgi:hypothetical protein
LAEVVAKVSKKVKRVAISSNGSADCESCQKLLDAGANDFSISLAACCAADGKSMAGGVDAFERVTDNIRNISMQTYCTVGIVITPQNIERVVGIIYLADSLEVADIRVIPAAQSNVPLVVSDLPDDLLDRHPILRWRWKRLQNGHPVRGLSGANSSQCSLVLDDMVVVGGYHYPCIIYLREGGKPIGKVGPNMMTERAFWLQNHNSHADSICSRNCLDFCSAYNDRVRDMKKALLSGSYGKLDVAPKLENL